MRPMQCAVCLTDRVIDTKHVERPPPHCCRAEQAMKLSRGVSRFVHHYCGILLSSVVRNVVSMSEFKRRLLSLSKSEMDKLLSLAYSALQT